MTANAGVVGEFFGRHGMDRFLKELEYGKLRTKYIPFEGPCLPSEPDPEPKYILKISRRHEHPDRFRPEDYKSPGQGYYR